MIPMKYVYLLQSVPYPQQKYIGLTSDLKSRLKAHNEGRSPHTSKYKPWKLITYVAFSDPDRAAVFERYLKSGSGNAFANKRLWQLASSLHSPAPEKSLIFPISDCLSEGDRLVRRQSHPFSQGRPVNRTSHNRRQPLRCAE